MSAPAVTARPGRPRDAEREDAIVAATLELLVEVGYERLTVEAVAARAKAGKATIYRRWEGKAGLVAEALRCRPVALPVIPDTGDLRADSIAAIGAFTADISARDIDLLAGVVAAMRTNPDLAELVRSQTVGCRRDAASAWLTRAQERGQIAPDVDVEVIAEIVPSMVFGRLLVTGEPVDEAFVTRLVDTVLLPLLRPER